MIINIFHSIHGIGRSGLIGYMTKKNADPQAEIGIFMMAEEAGFEPAMAVTPYSLSKRAH